MSKIRAFIAIELPNNVGLALFQAGQALSERVDSKRAVRWVPKGNLHLTLSFLGDIDFQVLGTLERELDDIGRSTSAFELHIGKLGCFPSRNKPRVIWVDLNGEISNLNRLNSDINEKLAKSGWDIESRRFHPHITLGRVKHSRQVVNAKFPWDLALDPLPVSVGHISLISSDLRPTGAVYTIQFRTKLTFGK